MTEIIVLVALPASGKTTLASGLGDDIVEVVDGDSLKTSTAVVAKVRSLQNCGKCIIVDATNATLERRAPLISIAKEWQIPIKCIWLKVNAKTCIQRAKERHEKGGKKIPAIAIYKINKTFVAPSVEEGFDEVVLVE